MKKNTGFNQQKLLKLLSQGSEQAFTQVFECFHSKVFNIAYEMLKSREMAKDVVQDVFAKIWIKRTAFADVRNLESFIFIMTRNLIMSDLRNRSNEIAAHYHIALTGNKLAANIEHHLADQQYEHLLNDAVNKLTPHQKNVYRLSRMEGLSHEAIAIQLNISKRTVNNHINKANKFIRASLSGLLKI